MQGKIPRNHLVGFSLKDAALSQEKISDPLACLKIYFHQFYSVRMISPNVPCRYLCSVEAGF